MKILSKGCNFIIIYYSKTWQNLSSTHNKTAGITWSILRPTKMKSTSFSERNTNLWLTQCVENMVDHSLNSTWISMWVGTVYYRPQKIQIMTISSNCVYDRATIVYTTWNVWLSTCHCQSTDSKLVRASASKPVLQHC